MKKRMILPIVLVLGVAIAPVPKAKAAVAGEVAAALKKLKLMYPLLNQLKGVSMLILEGFGLEGKKPSL